MDLKIKMNVEAPTLYELSFFSLDLLRLNFISTLIEEAQLSEKSKLITSKNIDRIYQNRSSLANYYLKNKKSIEVKEFNEGSIELVIAGVSVTAAIVIPIVLHYLNQKNYQNNQMVNFTVDSEDSDILLLLEEIGRKNFGSFEESFDFIEQTLLRRGYSFEAISDNTFKAIKANTNRIDDVILTTKRFNRF